MENRSFGSVFKDNLDLALQAVIADRFTERSSERSEGLTEFANPATVTQPVNPSQLPSGQAIVPGSGLSLTSPVVLLVGGAVLVGMGLLIARVL